METGATPSMSLPQRILGALVSPGKVFVYLAENPKVLGAMVFLAVVLAVVGVLTAGPALEDQIAAFDRNEQMTEEQRVDAVENVRKLMPILSPLGWLFFGLLPLFVVAAVNLFITRILLGGETTYKHMLAVSAHASMVLIPASLVRVPLSLSQGTVQDVQTGLAIMLSEDQQNTFLYNLLAQFDIFALWSVGLTILGVAIVARLSVNRVATALIVVWLLWVVGVSGLQTALAGLGG